MPKRNITNLQFTILCSYLLNNKQHEWPFHQLKFTKVATTTEMLCIWSCPLPLKRKKKKYTTIYSHLSVAFIYGKIIPFQALKAKLTREK